MFTWNGKNSLEMGLEVLPYTRTFHAAQRVVQTYIQGRDGTYDWSDGSRENVTISVPCVYFGSRAPATIRAVAAWLQGSGELRFSEEEAPDKYYQASIYNAADISRGLFEDSFTIVFTAFPYALGLPRMIGGTISASGESLRVETDGTAPTPCLITITNSGDDIIDTLSVMQIAAEE